MHKLISLPIAATAAVVVALLSPAPAQSRIVVNRGVDPVRIGMTPREVQAALGRPDVSERSGATVAMIYRSRMLVVTIVGGRVQIVSTRSRKQRTATGAGPGTPRSALRRRLSGEHCGRKAGVEVCKIGSSRSGRRSTVFLIVDGVVDTVSVALAP